MKSEMISFQRRTGTHKVFENRAPDRQREEMFSIGKDTVPRSLAKSEDVSTSRCQKRVSSGSVEL